MIPLNGIILGPYYGFFATLLGGFVGHFLFFRGMEEFLFGVGAAVGSAISGFAWNRRLLPVIAFYTLGLSSYFLTPISSSLPIWGMWDIYCAYIAVLMLGVFFFRVSASWVESRGRIWVGMCSFIGLEADVLFRIFLFIPLGTYQSIYGFPVEILREIWILSAVSTPLQVGMSVAFSYLIVPTVRSFVERKVYGGSEED
jgi:hypothetical protein